MFLAGRLRYVLLFAAVLCVVAFFRWNGRSSIFETVVYRINENVIKIGENTFLPYGDTEKAKKEIKRLQAERAELLRELARSKEDIRRLEFIAGLQADRYANATGSVRCRVVGRTPASWNEEVVVNTGERDGVEPGFIAITGDGLVGAVTEVSGGVSIVELITGNGAAASSVVSDSEIYGIVYGDGTGRLAMELVPSHLELKEGALVVTSGLGGTYPADLPVGPVVEIVHDEKKLSPYVEIRPAADIDNLSYLLLVKPEWQIETGQ